MISGQENDMGVSNQNSHSQYNDEYGNNLIFSSKSEAKVTMKKGAENQQ